MSVLYIKYMLVSCYEDSYQAIEPIFHFAVVTS